MARAAVSGRLTGWRAAELVASRFETAAARTLTLRVAQWPGHLPGQHVDVRLTAPDGYRAERSYSIAAPAEDDLIELTVQRVPDGEVSGYLVDGLEVGESIEIRGPVGGWFVWNPADGGAALLVAGGSGVVPIMSMLRAQRRCAVPPPVRTIYAMRDPGQLYYRDELTANPDLFLAYSRAAPPGDPRPPARLSAAELLEHGLAPSAQVTCYVCGPTGFVESVAAALVSVGHESARIRTERFGPGGR
ncbi:ferredoxin reductase [Nocardia arizonensis]|uniref:ferredoxin reductase n=1 Tax=Nocardia arizonensis TaxID=1141647 RepID=UPI0006D0FF22|nr:ferredoxin reductase [Nocardia arizonensis]